jgi:cell division control protein 45
MDLIDILQPPEDSVFYLIDSLRPFEVRNVYNGVQVKIIVLPNELSVEQKSVPEFDDIFEEDEETADDENVFEILYKTVYEKLYSFEFH